MEMETSDLLSKSQAGVNLINILRARVFVQTSFSLVTFGLIGTKISRARITLMKSTPGVHFTNVL